MPIEHLNQTVFLLLNAGPHASSIVVDGARLFAQGAIWLVPAGFLLGWLRGGGPVRQALLAATLAGLTGLFLNQVIGLIWYHPRPFELGIGRSLIPHVQDSSFPSDHLTLIWSIAFTLVLHRQTRPAGWVIALAGMLVGWARIYLGVHFPADILGALPVALVSAALARRIENSIAEPLMERLQPLYRTLFARLIRRGWVRD